jgi:hypothetical protein
MADAEDAQLADALQRGIDVYGTPSGELALTAEEQDWIDTARLAVSALRSGSVTAEQRASAHAALKRTPPAG